MAAVSALSAPRPLPGRPCGQVLLSHPGTQHSYQVALALQQENLLQSFLTGFYFNPHGRLARFPWPLSRSSREKLFGELSRRNNSDLNPHNVRTFPLAELLYVASTRLPPLRRLSGPLLAWRNHRFDQQVARALSIQRPAAVLCFDTCASRSFAAAHSLGIRCILDQSVGHIRAGAEIYRQEAALHPEFADSLPTSVPAELIDTCTREVHSADCILAASDYVRHTLTSVGADPSRIWLVPYGVDTSRFRPSPRRRSGIFRALFVGQLSQRKGIKYLLQAWQALRLPNSELLIAGPLVGSGEGLRPFSDCFRRLPPLPHSEVHHLFTTADLFIYPSLHEGSALAIYEALASGLPVITTPNSGSVVRDGREGFVVPIRDVAALQEKILLLYTNPELRRDLSAHARLRAEAFTWATYRRNLIAPIATLLSVDSARSDP